MITGNNLVFSMHELLKHACSSLSAFNVSEILLSVLLLYVKGITWNGARLRAARATQSRNESVSDSCMKSLMKVARARRARPWGP